MMKLSDPLRERGAGAAASLDGARIDEFLLEAWHIRPQHNSLVGPPGTVLVEARSMEVLLQLVEHAGEILPRSHLLEAVWGQSFVTEEVLTHAIWDLRRALGDNRRNPKYIETLPKRGYRLIAPVVWLDNAGSEALRQKYRGGAAATDDEVTEARVDSPRGPSQSDGTVIAAPSIAVLPFADMSPEQDQGYLCEGMAEELINLLAKLDGLKVTSRTSAFQFRAEAMDIREIGRRLNVTTVLEGGVRKGGSRLRITAQLVKVADGYSLWSERFDRKMEDVLVIQDEIAHRIAETLRITLSLSARRALHEAASTDAHAYDCYLRGRRYFDRRGTKRDHELARDLFGRAAKIDPGFSRAWAGIATCCSYLYMFFERSPSLLVEADATSREAAALDPALAEAHVSRGLVLSLSAAHDEAVTEFETALDLDPTLFEANYFYGHDCYARGDYRKAAWLLAKATEGRQEDYQAPILLGMILEALGNPAEAEAIRRRGLERAEKHLEMNPDDVRALYLAANALVALGEREKGLDYASRALAMDPEESAILLYNIACVFSIAGETQKTLDCLERAVRAGLGHASVVANDPDLAALRDHPRFRSLLRELERALRQPGPLNSSS